MITAKPAMFATALILAVSAPLTGAAEATREQAEAAYEANDYEGAEAIWRQLAETGDTEAMFALGALLLEGPGDVEVDHVASTEWFMQAAQLENPAAQFNLGNAYQKGRGIEQSDEKAVYWWQRAADQGMPNAAFNLGVQYLYGRGVPQDYQQALNRFQFAAARNHVGARRLLMSWGFEIPELAGSDPQDAARLARLMEGEPAAAPSPANQPELAAEPTTGTPVTASTPVTALATPDRSPAADTAPSPGPAAAAPDYPPSAGTVAGDASGMGRVHPGVAETQARETPASEGTTPTAAAPGTVAQAGAGNRSGETPGVRAASSGVDEARILAVPDGRFTLQLAVMSSTAGVDEFIRRYGLEGDLYRYSFARGSDTLHGVSMGNFASREEAGVFVEELSERMRQESGWRRPWVRPFADIQRQLGEAP